MDGGCFLAGGEDFRAHVAAGFGPFVVLLGQDGADQAEDRLAGGEDAHHVGAPADLLVEAFLIRPSWPGQAGGCCGWSVAESGEVAGESTGDAGVAGGVAGPAAGFGVGLQVLDVGELGLDRVAEFGPVMKLSQVSQMFA